MSQVEKKIKFIKNWYIVECAKLSFVDKIKLAKMWIEICTKDEEYEMAEAIKQEKNKIIRRHIKENKRKNSKKIIIWIYLCKRNISTWFKKNK